MKKLVCVGRLPKSDKKSEIKKCSLKSYQKVLDEKNTTVYLLSPTKYAAVNKLCQRKKRKIPQKQREPKSVLSSSWMC